MVYVVVFFFLGVKFHQNMENINFTPQMEYSLFFFWKKKMLNFGGNFF
jgi:hypothetical protein